MHCSTCMYICICICIYSRYMYVSMKYGVAKAALTEWVERYEESKPKAQNLPIYKDIMMCTCRVQS